MGDEQQLTTAEVLGRLRTGLIENAIHDDLADDIVRIAAHGLISGEGFITVKAVQA